MVLLWVRAALGVVPDCDVVAEIASEIGAFGEATAEVDDEIWPGWDASAVATGAAIGDGPWVAWFSAPTAPMTISCGEGSGVARARWIHRSLAATAAAAQLDTLRRPSLAILVDPEAEGWQPRDWLAIYAHELFHVHQIAVIPHDRLRDADRRRLLRAWAKHRDRIEPALHAELAAGWRVLAEGADPGTHAAARAARVALLAEIDPDLPAASERLEVLEGLARYVEVRVETDPKATAALGGPSDPAEVLSVNILSIGNGEWWYPTGFAAAQIVDAHVPGWKQRVFTEGFEPLLASFGP